MNDIVFELASPEVTKRAHRRLAQLGINVKSLPLMKEFNEDVHPRDEHGRWASVGDIRSTNDYQPGAESNTNEVLVDLFGQLKQNGFEPLLDYDEENYSKPLQDVQESQDYINSQIPFATFFANDFAGSFEAVEQYRDEAARALADGDPVSQPTLAGLDLINASPLTDATVYRGANFTDQQLANFTTGNSIDLPFASFSYNQRETEQYLNFSGNNNAVQFQLEPGAKGLPLQTLAPRAIYGEVVTSGRFDITSVTNDGSKTIVGLRQVGTFSTDEVKVK